MRMFEGPRADALDEAQRLEVDSAREAFRELEKLVKNIQLYGREHQSVERFNERLYEALSTALSAREELMVDVGPYELLVHDQPIYENPTPEGNFIYRFYMDGVRKLTFARGLGAEELDRFIAILLTDWDDPALFEDDSVTLLWQAELEHMTYRVVESFTEDIKDGQQEAYTVAGVVDRVREGAQAASSPAAAQRRGRRGVNIAGLNNGLTESNLGRFEEQPFAMDEVEFDTLGRMFSTTGRETLEKFIEILFKVNLAEESNSIERNMRVTGLFDRIADLLIDSGRIGDLERLMRQVRRLTGPEGTKLPENLRAIEGIFRHWTSRNFIQKVTEGLRLQENDHGPSLLAICDLLNSDAAIHLAQVAGELKDAEFRQGLWDVVERKAPGHEHEISQLLRRVDKDHAHAIFRLLHKTASSDQILFAVRCAFANSDGTVRLEGLAGLPPGEVHRHLDMIYEALDDASSTVRGKALHLLARIRKPHVHEHIMECIEAPRFQSLDLEEKRRYFATAALTGRPNDTFLEIFGHGGLLRKGNDEMRHCAAVGLGIRLHREAEPLLDRELKRRLRSELVAEACAWALQHFKCDREQRTRQLYDIFFKGTLSSGGA